MSLKSQLDKVRISTVQNIKHDTLNFEDFKGQLFDLKSIEKNEKLQNLLSDL